MRSKPLFALAAALLVVVVLLLTQLRGGGAGEPGRRAGAPEQPQTPRASTPEPAAPDAPVGRSLAGAARADEAATAPIDEPAAPPPNELRGLVLDAEGRGVEGCELRLLPEPADPFGGAARETQAPRSATTRADGRFLFTGVPPGERHELLARHPDFAMQLVPGVVVGERGSFEEPPIVLRRGKRLHGNVRDELGAPIAGATVELVAEGTPPGDEAFDRMTASTDLDGAYLFTGIPDGMRVVSARAPGFGAQTLARAIQFEDRIGQAHRRDFTLRRAAAVSGRVVSSDGRPLADARLFAQDRRDYMVHANAQARSDASGAFTIEGLQPGLYTVTATAPGHRRGLAREVSPPAQGLELVLEPTPSAHGRVVDAASGRPVERFSVRLRSEGLPGMASAPLGPAHELAHAPDGAFTLPDLFEGRFQVEVDAPGYAPGFSPSFACDGASDVRGLVVELRAGGGLRGLVLDAEGRPLRGATVACRDDGYVDDALSAAMGDQLPTLATRRSARTGADGVFRLTHLFPHDYQLRVSAPGFAPVALRGLAVLEGEERALEPIALSAASALRGRLFDAELRGVPGGRVFLRALDGPTAPALFLRKSGADGAFRFDDLAPGAYELAGAPPLPSADFARDPLALHAGAEGGRRVELAPGAEAQADVQLERYTAPPPVAEPPPSGGLNGEVSGAGAGDSVALELVPLAGGAALTTKTERGQYTFVRVPPGDYLLRVAGREAPVHEVTILVDRFTRQDLRLE